MRQVKIKKTILPAAFFVQVIFNVDLMQTLTLTIAKPGAGFITTTVGKAAAI